MKSHLDKRICVVGLGYIGLPTAAVLASRGYDVRGVEVNPKVVETINAGRAHVVEPDLDILVQAAVQTGKLKAYGEPAEADIFMLCVPTPVDEKHGPDLSYVEKAAAGIAEHLKPGNLVVLESTSPPGTTEKLADIVEQAAGLTREQVHFAHAPERVLPGKILREVVENDRIVGGLTDAATEVCAEFYRTFVTGELLLTHSRLAEMAKLVENAYRDVNIAFANELSLLADDLDLDVRELIRLANRHPRVNILDPGCGVGGHCIAVDPWFIIHQSPEKSRLIRMAREVNCHKTGWVVQRVLDRAERFKRPRIACLGLAYKPDIDDLRESPAVDIARQLIAAQVGEVMVVEPNLAEHDEFRLTSLDEALDRADVVVALVAHRPFHKISPARLAEKIIIDTCGVLHP
ncbi:UDP-N-acetyl-D-mannosamine dehydrogenase [Phycisphaerales bacterium AB-hyl4]|uniref:UDP-N-acetyl-D-mannosamine dehydrogenase n=1 Tax=Natronomicrosphaera hydrolytica TaxID=3242702 RepID=A0ABV4U6H2_9BACT